MITQVPVQTAIQEKLAVGELYEALGLLNAQGEHRFTGLFACESTGFHNAFLYDRDQPETLKLDEVIPYEASYCQFTCTDQKTYIIVDASEDPRFEGHPSRYRFKSYVAVPIHNEDGSLWGTLCYFDTKANSVRLEQIELLEWVGKLIKKRLHCPADQAEGWEYYPISA